MSPPVKGQWPPLTTIPAGGRAVVRDIRMARPDMRRLQGLGLRIGSVIEVLHQRGSGVVVSLEGNRIALGRGVAEHVLIEPQLKPQSKPQSNQETPDHPGVAPPC